MEEEKIKCPKCQSTQISAGKRGWKMTTGFIGSSNTVITCLKCGLEFKPGNDYQSLQQKKIQAKANWEKIPKLFGIKLPFIVLAIILLFIILLASSCNTPNLKEIF